MRGQLRSGDCGDYYLYDAVRSNVFARAKECADFMPKLGTAPMDLPQP